MEEIFTDTTLQTLIERGITHNHDLLIAINRIDIAEQYVKQAKSWLPKLDFQIAARYDYPSKNSLSGISTNSFLGQIILKIIQRASTLMELDIWGKMRNQQEATRAEYLQTFEAARAVQTQLVAQIANGYFNLLMLDKQLEVARKNLGLADTFLIATRLFRNSGSANSLAVSRLNRKSNPQLY